MNSREESVRLISAYSSACCHIFSNVQLQSGPLPEYQSSPQSKCSLGCLKDTSNRSPGLPHRALHPSSFPSQSMEAPSPQLPEPKLGSLLTLLPLTRPLSVPPLDMAFKIFLESSNFLSPLLATGLSSCHCSPGFLYLLGRSFRLYPCSSHSVSHLAARGGAHRNCVSDQGLPVSLSKRPVLRIT